MTPKHLVSEGYLGGHDHPVVLGDVVPTGPESIPEITQHLMRMRYVRMYMYVRIETKGTERHSC